MANGIGQNLIECFGPEIPEDPEGRRTQSGQTGRGPVPFVAELLLEPVEV